MLRRLDPGGGALHKRGMPLMGIQTQSAAETEEGERRGADHHADDPRHTRLKKGESTMAKRGYNACELGRIQIRVCARCGKRFPILSPGYAYKVATGKKQTYTWYCSYSCMRAIQRPLEEARKRKFEERMRRDILNMDALEAYREAKEKKKAAAAQKSEGEMEKATAPEPVKRAGRRKKHEET